MLFLDTTSDCEGDVTWLKNNQDPWSEVQTKWSKTFHVRQVILKKDLNVFEILSEFSIIKNPLGHTLIDADFQMRYPENYQAIFTKFEPVFKSLLEIRKRNLTPADNLILELIESPDVDKGMS